MSHDTAALELEQLDEEDDATDDEPVGLSFFSEASDANAAFVSRFLFGQMHLTSKNEARICDRIDTIYRRKLVDRGLLVQTNHTDARWDAQRADRERTFAPIEREPTEGDDMGERTASRRDAIVAMHLKLESKQGRSPSAQEIVDALGDGTTIGTVYTSLSVARKKGQLGARVKGDDDSPKTKALPAPKPRRRPRSSKRTEAAPASSLERDGSNDELVVMLRAKLERLDRTREKLVGLLEELGAS